jgi:hypothetical protein
MASKIMKEHKAEIEKYCAENRLSSEKLFALSGSFNDEFVAVQYFNPENGKDGLRSGCATPAPVVLWIRINGDTIIFEQTEHTMKYLAI